MIFLRVFLQFSLFLAVLATNQNTTMKSSGVRHLSHTSQKMFPKIQLTDRTKTESRVSMQLSEKFKIKSHFAKKNSKATRRQLRNPRNLPSEFVDGDRDSPSFMKTTAFPQIVLEDQLFLKPPKEQKMEGRSYGFKYEGRVKIPPNYFIIDDDTGDELYELEDFTSEDQTTTQETSFQESTTRKIPTTVSFFDYWFNKLSSRNQSFSHNSAKTYSPETFVFPNETTTFASSETNPNFTLYSELLGNSSSLTDENVSDNIWNITNYAPRVIPDAPVFTERETNRIAEDAWIGSLEFSTDIMPVSKRLT